MAEPCDDVAVLHTRLDEAIERLVGQPTSPVARALVVELTGRLVAGAALGRVANLVAAVGAPNRAGANPAVELEAALAVLGTRMNNDVAVVLEQVRSGVSHGRVVRGFAQVDP